MRIPRILLAAPKSGSGKTFLTCGLLQALKNRGLRAAAFKCGPDYIDPMFHKRVLHTPSRNLDTWFTSDSVTRFLMEEAARDADISVMEGVMGYFDGLGGLEWKASAYDLACVTHTPVILLVDAKGMSRSVIPYIKGFADYEEEKHIRGIILNRLSPMLYGALKKRIEEQTGIPVYGYVPECKDSVLESRHLGLLLPEEIGHLERTIAGLAAVMEQSLDIDGILSLAGSAGELEQEPDFLQGQKEGAQWPVTIGVAMDEAFCFYYDDNLRMLEQLGAKLIFFSPLHDETLPRADGLLFGGGYPELHGKELEQNSSMRSAVRASAETGMPILAECGGFMYLQESMCDLEGRPCEMAAVLPGRSENTGKLGRFGYVELTDSLTGLKIKGHEFHYYDSTNNGNAFHAVKPSGTREWDCMVRYKEVLAGYPHIYYPSNPRFVQMFLQKCRKFKTS